jgi:hypothetical protein
MKPKKSDLTPYDIRRNLENAVILESWQQREDGHGHTWRYKLARGMLQMLDEDKYKKSLCHRHIMEDKDE